MSPWLRRLLPTWSWFWEPSGGPTAGWPVWFDRIKRRPIVAHPVGAALVVAGFALVLKSPAVPAIAAALLAEGVNQYLKAVGIGQGGAYSSALWLNVCWREGLALAGALLAWGVLA